MLAGGLGCLNVLVIICLMLCGCFFAFSLVLMMGVLLIVLCYLIFICVCNYY